MSQASNYLENVFTDLIFRGQTFTPPAAIYISLHTADPTDDGSGDEVSGGSYSRVELITSLINWSGTQGAGSILNSSGTSGLSSNNVTIAFPLPTDDWGRITHFGVWDALIAGNLLVYGVLSIPKTINNGDAAPAFVPNSMSLSLL